MIDDAKTLWELLDRRAQETPDAPMLIDEADRTISFGEFRDRSERVAAGLVALGVTPEYIAGFQRLGYRSIPVSELVQLRALGITPEFARQTVGTQAALPPVSKLVEYKIFGKRR